MLGLFNKKKRERIKEYASNDAVLLDVRTASEFNKNHIKDSTNIPVQLLNSKMDSLDPEVPLIVYCAMGGRSTIAANKLKAQGFKVVDAGGINTVKKALNK